MTPVEEVVLRRAKRRIGKPEAWTQFTNASRPKHEGDEEWQPDFVSCATDDPDACKWCATAAVDRELIDLTDEERKALGWDMFTYMRIMARLKKAAESTGMLSESAVKDIDDEDYGWETKKYKDAPTVKEGEDWDGGALLYEEVYVSSFNDNTDHRLVMDMFELALGDRPGAEGTNA